MDQKLVLLLVVLVLAEAELRLLSSTIPQRSLREIASKRRQLSYIKTLLQDLDDRLEKLQKRACFIGIPGANCDYKQISGSGKDQSYWEGYNNPGKKRRDRQDLNNVL